MPDLRAATSAVALMLMVIPASGHAQSLSEAYTAALRHDPDQAAAEADRDASRENDALATSLFRPKAQIEGSAGYSRITSDLDDPANVLPDKVDGVSGGVLVGVEQPIVDGSARAQARQLRAGARAGDAKFQASRQQLALRVVQAYLDVLKAQDMLASLTAQEASARREQRAAQAASMQDARKSRTCAKRRRAPMVSRRGSYRPARSMISPWPGSRN
jgi:outer membrane protein TolC